jgi:uncharacterized damage-inducible protein DinB
MNSTTVLAQRVREVLLNGDWVALTNLKDTLMDIDLKTAHTPVKNLNTIALLAQHINYYISGLNHFFSTGKLEIKDASSFDFPACATEADWKKVKEKITTDSETFVKHVENLTEADLNKIFVKEAYGNYRRNINVIIEHSFYHLGQIVLLKKYLQS